MMELLRDLRARLSAARARVERLERTYAGVLWCDDHLGNGAAPGCAKCARAREMLDDRAALCAEILPGTPS